MKVGEYVPQGLASRVEKWRARFRRKISFTIDNLSTSPEGLTVKTDKTLRVQEGHEGKRRGSALTPEQRQAVGKEMQDEVKRAKRLAGVPENTHNITLSRKQREEYITHMTESRKIGLRTVRQKGNTLVINVTNPYFRTYKLINKSSESARALELANPTGNAVILQTADGKLILQYRKAYDEEKRTGNFFYGGIPGASIAGMFDVQRGEKGTGRPKAISNEDIKEHILEEAQEEIGLPAENMISLAVMGLATDKSKIHREFLIYGKTNLTYDQLKKAKQQAQEEDYRFAEKFFAIDATPRAIETLLTQVKCPLPPTHAAAFIAAGYAMTLEEGLAHGLSQKEAVRKARKWKRVVEKGVQENYRQIDEQVVAYWKQHPEDAKFHSPNRPVHNTTGYDAAYAPAEQGLSSLEKELERTGLSKPEIE